MPIELKRTDSIGSVTYTGRDVNLSGEKFPDVFAKDIKQEFSRETDSAEAGLVKRNLRTFFTLPAQKKNRLHCCQRSRVSPLL